jgi:hypothetical protein
VERKKEFIENKIDQANDLCLIKLVFLFLELPTENKADKKKYFLKKKE